MAEKLLVAYPWGPEDPPRAESLFFLALTARSLEIDVAIFLFIDGVVLARKGIAEKVSQKTAQGLADALKRGAKIYACASAIQAKGIPESDLVDGVTVIGYATFINMLFKADRVLTL